MEGNGLRALPKVPANAVTGAALPMAGIRSHTLKLPATLGEAKLAVQAEIKMYEEGGLDSEKEYVMDYVAHELPGTDSVIVETYAAEHAALHEAYDVRLKKIGALDYLVPAFWVYTALYSGEFLQRGEDLWLYLSPEQSFLGFYHQGECVAYRAFESLEEMARKVGMDLPKLKKELHAKGLVQANYPLDEIDTFLKLQAIFAKAIERIVHTVNARRSLFGFAGVDRLLIDFEGTKIEGLAEMFEAYGLELQSAGPLQIEGADPVRIHAFALAQTVAQSEAGTLDALNLTIFERQPSWFRRIGGKFALTAAASLIVAAVHPLYLWQLDASQRQQIGQLDRQVRAITAEAKKFKQQLKEAQAANEARRKQRDALAREADTFEASLDALPLIVQMHRARQTMTNDVVAALARYRLSVLQMDQNGSKTMRVHLSASYAQRDDIAKFMKRLLEAGYQNISTRQIILDETAYESIVEIER